MNLVLEAKKIVADFKKTAPASMKIVLVNDMSYFIRRRLGVLTSNGLIGIILVLVSLFIFLSRPVAFFTALGLPIAFLTTFAVRFRYLVSGDEVKEYLKTMPGVKDVDDDYGPGKDEVEIIINEEKAARAGLSVGEIARSIRNVIRGGIATTIKPTKAEEEVDVLVRYPPSARNRTDLFDSLLTLILIPCVYAIVDDLSLRFLHRGTVKRSRREWTKN